MICLALGALCAGGVADFAPARASEPEKLGAFGLWSAQKVTEGGQPVCYMSLVATPPPPAKGKGKPKDRRGDIILMITHRPAENSADVVSYTAGEKFKPATEVQVQVGPKTFALFTQGDTAWSRDSATDRALTLALRGAANARFSGTPARKDAPPIADTLPLKGMGAAYAAIGKSCGVTVPPLPSPPKEKKADAKPTAGKASKPAPKTSGGKEHPGILLKPVGKNAPAKTSKPAAQPSKPKPTTRKELSERAPGSR